MSVVEFVLSEEGAWWGAKVDFKFYYNVSIDNINLST